MCEKVHQCFFLSREYFGISERENRYNSCGSSEKSVRETKNKCPRHNFDKKIPEIRIMCPRQKFQKVPVNAKSPLDNFENKNHAKGKKQCVS